MRTFAPRRPPPKKCAVTNWWTAIRSRSGERRRHAARRCGASTTATHWPGCRPGDRRRCLPGARTGSGRKTRGRPEVLRTGAATEDRHSGRAGAQDRSHHAYHESRSLPDQGRAATTPSRDLPPESVCEAQPTGRHRFGSSLKRDRSGGFPPPRRNFASSFPQSLPSREFRSPFSV